MFFLEIITALLSILNVKELLMLPLATLVHPEWIFYAQCMAEAATVLNHVMVLRERHFFTFVNKIRREDQVVNTRCASET